MNNYMVGVFLAMFIAVALTLMIPLKYSEATLLFGLVAAACSPLVLHKVPNSHWSLSGFIALAFFASYPFRQLFQIESLIYSVLVISIYFTVLWVIGVGWKRRW